MMIAVCSGPTAETAPDVDRTMSRLAVFSLLLLGALALAAAAPQFDFERQIARDLENQRDPYRDAALDRAREAIDTNDYRGLNGGWEPKSAGIRAYESDDGNFRVGVGASTDFHSNHGVGVVGRWRF